MKNRQAENLYLKPRNPRETPGSITPMVLFVLYHALTEWFKDCQDSRVTLSHKKKLPSSALKESRENQRRGSSFEMEYWLTDKRKMETKGGGIEWKFLGGGGERWLSGTLKRNICTADGLGFFFLASSSFVESSSLVRNSGWQKNLLCCNSCSLE